MSFDDIDGRDVSLPATKTALVDIWMIPIRRPLRITAETADKPLGEMTMPDLMAWVAVLGYGGLTGYVLGRIAGNILVVALGGRR